MPRALARLLGWAQREASHNCDQIKPAQSSGQRRNVHTDQLPLASYVDGGTTNMQRSLHSCGERIAGRRHRTAALHMCNLRETQPVSGQRLSWTMGTRTPLCAGAKI